MEADDSLGSLWAAAEEARIGIEATGNALDPDYGPKLADVIAKYATIQTHISSLSLFSPNESLEDLTTVTLQYLLCPARLASLTMRIPSESPSARKSIIARARSHYEGFLNLLSSYSLLSDAPLATGAPTHASLFKAYIENPADFSMTPSSDPNARRTSKMANYKAEKELKSKLNYLVRHPSYAAGIAGTGPADEDAVRKVYLAQIEMTAHEAFHSLDGINQEAQILFMAPDPDARHGSGRADEDARRRQGAVGGLGDSDYSDRLDRPLQDITAANKAPLLSSSGKPLRPFTLVGARQEMARGVFRPGHNLPTMSIDEYLEEEKRRGNFIEGGGEASFARPEPDEDNMEKADEETYKARAWDEFTEANPKGAGNTLNRG